jgi:hypothetical protein
MADADGGAPRRRPTLAAGAVLARRPRRRDAGRCGGRDSGASTAGFDRQRLGRHAGAARATPGGRARCGRSARWAAPCRPPCSGGDRRRRRPPPPGAPAPDPADRWGRVHVPCAARRLGARDGSLPSSRCLRAIITACSEGRGATLRTRPGHGQHTFRTVSAGMTIALEAVLEVQLGHRGLAAARAGRRSSSPRGKKVVEVGGARLPGVGHQAARPAPGGRASSYSTRSRLSDVGVLLDLHEVGHGVEERPLNPPATALQRVEQRVVRVDVGGEVDDVVEQRVALAGGRDIRKKCGRTSSRAVEVGRRVDERHVLRGDRLPPVARRMGARLIGEAGRSMASACFRKVQRRGNRHCGCWLSSRRFGIEGDAGRRKGGQRRRQARARGSILPMRPALKKPQPSASLRQPPYHISR